MDKYSEMMSGDEYGNIDYGTQNVMKPEGLGGAHNHLSNSTYNHIAVFTPEDLCVFATIANYTRVPITDITHYVVSPEGIYAIKFATENPDNLLNFAVEYLNNAIFNNDVLSKYQENNIIHGKPKTAQEKGFLNVIKQYNLQIELYETDDNLQNWKKIELSANNELQYTPC